MDPARNYASWVKVDSSAISEFIWYEESSDPRKPRLAVRFRQTGKVYTYRGVPENVYRALLNASSRGRFLNVRIIPNYPFTPG